MNDTGRPYRRESDTILSELLRQSAEQHTENRETLGDIKNDVSEIKTTTALVNQRLSALEVWKKEEADPAIAKVNNAKWLFRGAAIVGGGGGLAGVAAAIKAFILGAAHQ